MVEPIASRLSALTQGRLSALRSAILTVLAPLAALLVAEAAVRLLSDTDGAHVRLAVLVTAALVATPVIAALVWAAIRMQAEILRLRIRDTLLGAAQGYARQGRWEFDVATGQLILSKAMHDLLGDPDKKLRLTVPELIEIVSPEDREVVTAALGRVLTEGSQEQIEYRITGLDGKERTFWVTAAAQIGADGIPMKVFGVSQDISERKETEAALRESEDHYRHAVDLSPFIPWVEDSQGNTLELSPRWFELTGLPVEASLGNGWTEAIHPDDLELTKAAWEEGLRTGEPYGYEHRVLVADGSYRWFRSRAAPRRNASGEISHWYGGVEDVHAHKSAEIALQESEAFANSILESTTDCIDVMDLSGRVQFLNGACRRLMDAYGYDVPVGKEWIELWPADLKPRALEAFSTAKSGVPAHFNCFGLTADKKMGYWDVGVWPILGPTGNPERLLCMSRDITAQKEAQDELEQARAAAEVAAKHDSLTGLLNRAGFREQLKQQLEKTRNDSGTAVLFLDLDEFKSVNDALGHPAGDQVLKEAAARLQACMRESDLIARFGGDEFAVLQTAVTDTAQFESLAQRLIDCISEPYRLDGREIVIGVSIGIVVVDAPGVEVDDLLKRSDIALYQAKHAGRGVYRFFEAGMDTSAEEHQRLRSELRDAVTRGEFRIFYQPIVKFETSRVISFEALLRWQHPRRGLLSPADFISLAEATGDIEELGDWVLREACSMAITWPEEISVSVNLSSSQFKGSCLVQAVAHALAASGLPAHRLQLEIAESVFLQDDAVVGETLKKLQAIGVRISIDDFGMGYSSLGYLRQFSVDNIKINQSFVTELEDNPRTAAILRALMALGQDLGVSIMAEGVETITHMKKLTALGCSEGQGYLFGRAMPADAVQAFLSDDRHFILDHTMREQKLIRPPVIH